MYVYVSHVHLSIQRYRSCIYRRIKNYGDWYMAQRIYVRRETDNKTPREFFRITSGLLVRYTRQSCMTRQKCSSGAHGRGENERGSPWYIAGLEKWFSPAGESGDPEMQFTLWLTTNRLPESRSVTDTRTHTCIHVHTDASSHAFAKWIWIARVIHVRFADFRTTLYACAK